MNIKAKTKPFQKQQTDLSAEQLDFVAGGGLRVWGDPYPEPDPFKQLQQAVQPIVNVVHAVDNAVSWVGHKIAGFFSSIF